jgi:NAD(P)-dependent dehydrogenase (short-subunit alcohol dehydrogenase family)
VWIISYGGSNSLQTILITGGNSGTGFATAVAYYAAGARVIIACRSPGRASTAVEQIKRGAVVNMAGEAEYPATPPKGGSIEAIELDLADLRSVEACAERLNKDLTKLDIRFANAGIMAL